MHQRTVTPKARTHMFTCWTHSTRTHNRKSHSVIHTAQLFYVQHNLIYILLSALYLRLIHHFVQQFIESIIPINSTAAKIEPNLVIQAIFQCKPSEMTPI